MPSTPSTPEPTGQPYPTVPTRGDFPAIERRILERWDEQGTFEQPNLSGQATWAHPVIANGRLYIQDQGLLLCYDVKAP